MFFCDQEWGAFSKFLPRFSRVKSQLCSAVFSLHFGDRSIKTLQFKTCDQLSAGMSNLGEMHDDEEDRKSLKKEMADLRVQVINISRQGRAHRSNNTSANLLFFV